MPELPEVETFARTLAGRVTGRRVSSCRLMFAPLLKSGTTRALENLRGRRIERLGRRGKYLLFHCQGGLTLVFHLKMTGRFRFVPKGEKADKHTRLVLSFRGPTCDVHFSDVRKFGCLYAVPTDDLDALPALAGLGPEPLDLKLEEFRALIRGRKGRLKSLLLNQCFVAGIGNIYADEILFRSRLHPLKSTATLKPDEVRRLWLSMKAVLKRAIERGGSSVRDYADSEGRPGRFQQSHRVYGRKSLPCFRCGRPIERQVIGGRSSFYCPVCQPAPKPN